MELELVYRQVAGAVVAELTAGRVADERDATDLVGNAAFGGARFVMLGAEMLAPEFFDLSTGLAGTVLQKFSTYRLILVVVGYNANQASESMLALIRESNRGGVAWFVADEAEALARVAGFGG
ncbi:MAG: DUF4180 domain-containing protein [Trueperaceae bacterium]|jgi:hypothetical protein